MSRTQQVVAAIGLAGLISAAGIALAKRGKTPPPPPDSRFFTGTAADASRPTTLYVYVAGEVIRPGVYPVAEGCRVRDAIVAAGGPTTNADLSEVNLAALLQDGERVSVPTRAPIIAPVAPGPRRPASPRIISRISINRATAKELESLPGIGPKTAQRIVAYRQRNGYFRKLDDLKDVSGIGDKKLAQLRPFITL